MGKVRTRRWRKQALFGMRSVDYARMGGRSHVQEVMGLFTKSSMRRFIGHSSTIPNSITRDP